MKVLPRVNRVPALTWTRGGPTQVAGAMHAQTPGASRKKLLMNCCSLPPAQYPPPRRLQLIYVHNAGALLGPKRGANRGDQLLGVDRLVDAIDEAGGHQALALDLG